MNVQIICFVDIWLKGLCLNICNNARCNKELVSQDSSTVERSKEPLIPSMSKIVW